MDHPERLAAQMVPGSGRNVRPGSNSATASSERTRNRDLSADRHLRIHRLGDVAGTGLVLDDFSGDHSHRPDSLRICFLGSGLELLSKGNTSGGDSLSDSLSSFGKPFAYV